jgi:glycosyltransferase involved in cell wall biosynthesis
MRDSNQRTAITSRLAALVIWAARWLAPLVRLLPREFRRRVGERLFARACDGQLPRPLRGDLPRRGTAGVNLFGLLQGFSGVSEAARGSLRALQASQIPCETKSFTEEHLLWGKPLPSEMRQPGAHRVNLCHVNADTTPHFLNLFGGGVFEGRINIGFWMWELEQFPAKWDPVIEYFDEIWAPSQFVHDAIAARAQVPVTRIPLSVSVEMPAHDYRGEFGIPSDKYAILCMFDAASHHQRKNPFAAVRAVQMATSRGKSPLLVLKMARSASEPGLRQRLQEELQGVDCLIIDQWLEREQTWGLTSACDALISLHRSEGFGLVLAEAMALGKPVIATGYSANTDFMTNENSLLVRHKPVTIEQDIGPYPAGAVWADPDVEHAAECIERLMDHPETGQSLGARAAADVVRLLSPVAVGLQMRDRLEGLGLKFPSLTEPQP